MQASREAESVHVFKHHAMATEFQVRIADQERSYAAQAAQAVFNQADALELLLSRFHPNSEIKCIAQLLPGDTLRLSEPVFCCLQIARRMESATDGAFSIAPAARQTPSAMPLWSLDPERFLIRCDRGRLEFDLGAIGKGFALDRMADTLRDWDCCAFMLVSGGSSIVVGDAPAGVPGWSCGMGDGKSSQEVWLQNCSLSGSGLGIQGCHILDPRTGRPACRRERAWALADTGAESDALSTACMVLDEGEIAQCVEPYGRWLVFLNKDGAWQWIGNRQGPLKAT